MARDQKMRKTCVSVEANALPSVPGSAMTPTRHAVLANDRQSVDILPTEHPNRAKIKEPQFMRSVHRRAEQRPYLPLLVLWGLNSRLYCLVIKAQEELVAHYLIRPIQCLVHRWFPRRFL